MEWEGGEQETIFKIKIDKLMTYEVTNNNRGLSSVIQYFPFRACFQLLKFFGTACMDLKGLGFLWTFCSVQGVLCC